MKPTSFWGIFLGIFLVLTALATDVFAIPPSADSGSGDVASVGQGRTSDNTVSQRRDELNRTRRKIETIRNDIQRINAEVDRLLRQIQVQHTYVTNRQRELASCRNLENQYQISGLTENTTFRQEVDDCFRSLARDSETYRWILHQARAHLATMQRLKSEAEGWNQRIPSLEDRIHRLESEIRFLEGEKQ